MKYLSSFFLLSLIILVSCEDNKYKSDCSIDSYYDNGSKREMFCFESDTLKYIEFDKSGDTLFLFVFEITDQKDTVSLYSKKYKNNKVDNISYSNDGYYSAYTVFFNDSSISYQYNVDGDMYYKNIDFKSNNVVEKIYPAYLPKIALANQQLYKDSISINYSMPIPDSLLHPRLYLKYGLTQFEKVPDDQDQLDKLIHSIVLLDSFKVLGHKSKTIKLETDSTSNFIGFIYDPLDSGYHGVEIIDLTH